MRISCFEFVSNFEIRISDFGQCLKFPLPHSRYNRRRDAMKRLLMLPILFLTCGCLSQMNQRLDTMNQKLEEMSAKVDETNRLLASVEKTATRVGKLVP